MSPSSALSHQLEELHLLKCSLLPGERLVFIEDTEHWDSLLEAYADDPEGCVERAPSNLRRPCFVVKVEEADVWFEIELPFSYGLRKDNENSESMTPVVSVKGEYLARDEQARWQGVVQEKVEAARDSECSLYELISSHLLPLLHEYADATEAESAPQKEPGSTSASPSSSYEHYHALLTSHHLVAPSKRRSMHAWASELSLTGFAKLGHPGVIYCEGTKQQVEEFVGRVKAMQWLALRVRFVEPLEEPVGGKENWVEFEKVGEVVAEMRRLGRERYVVEMGIGSAGSK